MLVRKEGRSSKTIEGRWKIVILGGRVPHVWKKLQIKSSWRCSNHNVESTEIHLELCTFLVQWNIHHETSVLQLDITYLMLHVFRNPQFRWWRGVPLPVILMYIAIGRYILLSSAVTEDEEIQY